MSKVNDWALEGLQSTIYATNIKRGLRLEGSVSQQNLDALDALNIGLDSLHLRNVNQNDFESLISKIPKVVSLVLQDCEVTDLGPASDLQLQEISVSTENSLGLEGLENLNPKVIRINGPFSFDPEELSKSAKEITIRGAALTSGNLTGWAPTELTLQDITAPSEVVLPDCMLLAIDPELAEGAYNLPSLFHLTIFDHVGNEFIDGLRKVEAQRTEKGLIMPTVSSHRPHNYAGGHMQQFEQCYPPYQNYNDASELRSIIKRGLTDPDGSWKIRLNDAVEANSLLEKINSTDDDLRLIVQAAYSDDHRLRNIVTKIISSIVQNGNDKNLEVFVSGVKQVRSPAAYTDKPNPSSTAFGVGDGSRVAAVVQKAIDARQTTQ